MKNKYFISERLLYRPARIEDLQTCVRFNNEPSRRKWFYFQEPDCLTEEFALRSIQENIEMWDKKVNVLDGADLFMTLKKTGELIGSVGISRRTRPEVHLDGLEIGYHVAEAYQGKGYATEGAKAALEWAVERFREINIYPIIECHVEHEHKASRRVAEKAGFVFNRSYKYVIVYIFDTRFET